MSIISDYDTRLTVRDSRSRESFIANVYLSLSENVNAKLKIQMFPASDVRDGLTQFRG